MSTLFSLSNYERLLQEIFSDFFKGFGVRDEEEIYR